MNIKNKRKPADLLWVTLSLIVLAAYGYSDFMGWIG